jgi:oxalate decarboxylase
VEPAQDVPAAGERTGRTSRRRAIGAIAGGGLATGIAAAMARNGAAWDATPAATVADASGTTPFNYRLGASTPQVFAGGTLRTATKANIDSLLGLSLNVLEIYPGAARELHWHPNCGEINYCLSGEGIIGVLSAAGDWATFAIVPESITFIPVGDAHYIRNTGSEPLQLLIAFSSEEPGHLDLSQVLPWVPDDLLNQTLGVAPGTLPALPPRGDLTVVNVEGTAEPTSDAPTDFSTQVSALAVQEFAGGTVQPVRVDVIPRLDGMTLLKLDIDGGALREPHWHGNASEFNYCASGTAQVGIVAPSGESWTFVVETGDVAYIPKNWFHYIASLDDEPLVFLAIFDNVAPNRVDLSGMADFFPPEVLAASFGVDPAVFGDLPKRGTVVIAPPVSPDADDATPAS